MFLLGTWDWQQRIATVSESCVRFTCMSALLPNSYFLQPNFFMFSFPWFTHSVKVTELLRAADVTVTWMAMDLILILNTVDPLFQQIHGL